MQEVVLFAKIRPAKEVRHKYLMKHWKTDVIPSVGTKFLYENITLTVREVAYRPIKNDWRIIFVPETVEDDKFEVVIEELKKDKWFDPDEGYEPKSNFLIID